jgi:two-component system, chemotaxis family, chemotaxis protein CheY
MRTILLVDDSRVTRELIKVYLIAKDVTLLEAGDGEEALRVARERRPDLVLADFRMPRLDGPGLCEALKRDYRTSSLPVVILTGNKDAESARKCLLAGAREVLTKPVQPQQLLDAVNRQLRDGRPA